MDKNTTTITGIEQGRAKFAYECAHQVLSLQEREIGQLSLVQEYLRKKFNDKPNEPIFREFIADALNKSQEIVKKKNEKKSKPFEDKLLSIYTKYGKEYKSYVKKIPMLIKTNGLGATFAFVLSKAEKGNPYYLIYEQTTAWLKADQKKLLALTANRDLINTIITLDSSQYRAVTNEVLAFLNWLKRFADGLIEGEAEA